MRLAGIAGVLGVLGTAVWAEVPKVVTDIAPVQSLAARVMGGLGEPGILVPQGMSPHSMALKPSQAAALAEADEIFYVAPALTPWLVEALERLSGDAEVLALLEAEGSIRHKYRQGVVFGGGEEHDHEMHEGNDKDHAEGEDHDDHDHEGEGDEHAHDHHHDPNATDPHGWLDPENGKVWLGLIAERLARADPEHAETYRANAKAGAAEIDAVAADAAARLAGLHDARYVVFHDAYQYFELRFGLKATGSILLGDATAPGPKRIATLRKEVAELGVRCAFTEPQFDPRLLNTVFGDTGVKTAALDPMGVDLTLGPTLYPDLIREIAQNIAGCLADD